MEYGNTSGCERTGALTAQRGVAGFLDTISSTLQSFVDENGLEGAMEIEEDKRQQYMVCTVSKVRQDNSGS